MSFAGPDDIEAFQAMEAEESPRAAVLDEAKRLTCGDRLREYGEPVGNLTHIAAVFNAMTGRDLTAREAGLFLVALKAARLSRNALHRDSYVDGAAYLGMTFEAALAEAG